MSDVKKARMAVPRGTLPGTEVDAKGHYIPLQERTEDDQAKVRDLIADALRPDDASDKNPNGEFQNPAPIPDGMRSGGQKGNQQHHDLQGHQGGQRGGSHEP